MRFRANVEDVGSFFSKSLNRMFGDRADDALDSRRDYTGHREAAKEMYHQVYGVSYAHYLQPRRERGWGPSLVVSRLCSPSSEDTNDACDSRQVKVQSIFSDYRIQSNANNEVTILISPEALLLALRSAWNPASLESTPETVMKLAKKNDQAVLSFDISGSMSSGRMVRVGHDVRIEVMKPSDVKKLTEPMCPEPDVRYFTITQTATLNGVHRDRSTFCCPRCRSYAR
jgi:hypothetical protein